MRCSHIGVIKIFPSASEKVVPEKSHQRTTEQRIQNDCAENGIAQDLNRVLVEGRHELDTRRRMMNLVKDEPPSFYVSESVPPIKEERADEPTDEAFEQWHVP